MSGERVTNFKNGDGSGLGSGNISTFPPQSPDSSLVTNWVSKNTFDVRTINPKSQILHHDTPALLHSHQRVQIIASPPE